MKRRSALTAVRVRSVRTKLGLTQEQLANVLGVTWTTVSRWEGDSSSPTGMPARLLFLLEESVDDRKFLEVLRSSRGRDPLQLVFQLLNGVYGPAAVGRRGR